MNQISNSEFLNSLVVNKAAEVPRTNLDAYEFLKNTAQNRFLYWFALNYCTSKNLVQKVRHFLKEAKELGNHKKKQFNTTLQLIEKISKIEDLQYIVAKGERDFAYINSDIDLLVKENDLHKWLGYFKQDGYLVKDHNVFMAKQPDQYNLINKGLYKVDITTKFNWQEGNYFDLDFLWTDYAKHKLGIEADFLVNLGSIMFKRMSLGLLDYYFIKNILNKNLDWKIIEEQAHKYGWEKSLLAFMKFFNQLDPKKNEFPVLFDFPIYFIIFKEKFARKTLSLNYLVYFILARARYHLLNKQHLPFHVYWFPHKRFKQLKGLKLTT